MYLQNRCVLSMNKYQIRMIRLCVLIHCCNWPHTWRIIIADRLCCRWGTWRWSTTPWSSSPRQACRKHSFSAAGWPAKSKNTCSECHPADLSIQSGSSDTCCNSAAVPWQEVQVVSTQLSQHGAHHHLRHVPVPRGRAQGCWCKISGALRFCTRVRRCGLKYWH